MTAAPTGVARLVAADVASLCGVYQTALYADAS